MKKFFSSFFTSLCVLTVLAGIISCGGLSEKTGSVSFTFNERTLSQFKNSPVRSLSARAGTTTVPYYFPEEYADKTVNAWFLAKESDSSVDSSDISVEGTVALFLFGDGTYLMTARTTATDGDASSQESSYLMKGSYTFSSSDYANGTLSFTTVAFYSENGWADEYDTSTIGSAAAVYTTIPISDGTFSFFDSENFSSISFTKQDGTPQANSGETTEPVDPTEPEKDFYYELTISVNGDYSETKTVTVTQKYETYTVTFDAIPVGAAVYFVADVYSYDGETKPYHLFTGKSDTITIVAGDNMVTMQMENVARPDKQITYSVEYWFEDETGNYALNDSLTEGPKTVSNRDELYEEINLNNWNADSFDFNGYTYNYWDSEQSEDSEGNLVMTYKLYFKVAETDEEVPIEIESLGDDAYAVQYENNSSDTRRAYRLVGKGDGELVQFTFKNGQENAGVLGFMWDFDEAEGAGPYSFWVLGLSLNSSETRIKYYVSQYKNVTDFNAVNFGASFNGTSSAVEKEVAQLTTLDIPVAAEPVSVWADIYPAINDDSAHVPGVDDDRDTYTGGFIVKLYAADPTNDSSATALATVDIPVEETGYTGYADLASKSAAVYTNVYQTRSLNGEWNLLKTYEGKEVDHSPLEFTITLDMSNVAADKTLDSVTIYSLSKETADSLTEVLSDETIDDTEKVKTLSLRQDSDGATYLGGYRTGAKALTVADDGTIIIEDSYPAQGTMGIGKNLSIIAFVSYGEAADISSAYVGVSDVLKAQATNSVNMKPISYSPTLERIEITSSTLNLNVGESGELQAYAIYSDGTRKDVSSDATWTSSGASVATVNGYKVEGIAAGTATITAAYGNMTVICNVTVIQPAADAGISVTLDEVSTEDAAIGLTYTEGEDADGNKTIVFTANEGFKSYLWLIEDENVETTAEENSLTIHTAEYAAGAYHLTLVVTDKTGESYGATATFTVTK